MIETFLADLKTKGWTQEAIAAKAGVRQSLISKLARGGECSTGTLIKLADAFHVSTDKVLGREGIKKENNHDKNEERRRPLKARGGTA